MDTDLQHMFDKLHQQLKELGEQHRQNHLSTSAFEKELRKFSETSEWLLEEWIQFEDHLHEYTAQMPHTDPEPQLPEWQKAQAYYDLMMFEQALRPLQKVVQYHPDFEPARLYLAHAYLATDQLASAKYELQFLLDTSVREEVQQLSAHGLGCISGTMGEYVHSRHYFNKIILDQVREEWKPIFVYNQGQTLFQLQQYEESKQKFKAYQQFVPDDWRGLFFLGKIEHELGREEEGFAYWFSALQKEEHPHLLKALAEQFEKRTFHQMAAQCYERILKRQRSSKDVQVWFGLAWNTGLTGNRLKSEHMYKKALSLFPDHIQLQASYVWMLLYWQERSTAQLKLEKLKRIADKHPLTEGLSYIVEGDYEQACHHLQQQT